MTIDSYAFNGCSNLISIDIPNGVTNIGYSAFYNCSSLTSITIPNGVTSIGNNAFSGCGSLRTITIPNSVTSIGNYAFEYCSSLTIYCEVSTKPNGWFSSWNGETSVYWYRETQPTEEGNYWHYVDGVATKW